MMSSRIYYVSKLNNESNDTLQVSYYLSMLQFLYACLDIKAYHSSGLYCRYVVVIL